MDMIPIQQFSACDDRLNNLIKSFHIKYKTNANFIVKVPGRVNLVGEHIDYSGFPVISMAIEQNISIAVSREHNSLIHNNTQTDRLAFHRINLSNTSKSYQNHSFTDTSALNNLVKPEWYHYVICGYKGVMENAEENFRTQNLLHIAKHLLSAYTINILVTGDIPHSSGLSSSSALVVASSIAFSYCIGLILDDRIKSGELDASYQNHVNQIFKMSKHEMAFNCAYYERYIGTQGGGIDQAIQMLAEKETAKLIKFRPKLDACNVELPKDCQFFVLHCGKTLNKASTIHYNVRVFETRVAALLLKRYQLALENRSMDEIRGKKILLSDFETTNENPYCDLIEQLENLFDNSKGELTIGEIQELINVNSYESLCETIAFPVKSLNLIVESNSDQYKFNLLDRATHVYKEVNRVLKMQSIDSGADNEIKLNVIGQLLNESHQSLKELYECSCDELDKLAELSILHGAKGSKLTGAGWAGCLVAIVPSNKVEDYERNLSSHCKFMIKTKANQGSVIYSIE